MSRWTWTTLPGNVVPTAVLNTRMKALEHFLNASDSSLATAVTATSLATSRTIWGQSFNGTANVSGALTGVTSITASETITADAVEVQGAHAVSASVDDLLTVGTLITTDELVIFTSISLNGSIDFEFSTVNLANSSIDVTDSTFTGLTAADVSAGTFGAGDYVFPSDLTVTDNVVIGTDPGGALRLRVGGSIFANGLTTTFGSTTGASLSVGLDGAAGTQRDLVWRSAGVGRWTWRVDSMAESGSDAGSPLVLIARTDAGVLIDTVVNITRAADGSIALGRPLIWGSDNARDIGASGATRPRTGYFGTAVVVGTDPGGAAMIRVGGNIHTQAAGASGDLFLDAISNNTTSQTVSLRKARGTAGTKLYPGAFDSLGALAGFGWDEAGGDYAKQAQIVFPSWNAWTASDRSAYIAFQTTATSSTSRTEKWAMWPVGDFKPSTDNTVAIGDSTRRVTTVFGYTGNFATEVVTPSLDSGSATDLLLQRNNVTQLTLGSLAATFAGTIATSAPTGGAGAWELGIANSVSPTAPNRTITIEIGGTAYYLHAKTTND